MLHGLVLITHIHLVIFLLVPAFAGFHMDFANVFAAFAFDAGDHRRRVGAQPAVDGVTTVVVVVADTDGDFFIGRVIVEDGQLALLMDRKGGVVEALVVGPGFLDVTHVPLADMDGVIAGL